MSKSVCEPDRKNLTKRLPDRTCEMCARDSACDDTINWQYFFLKAQYVLDSDDEGFDKDGIHGVQKKKERTYALCESCLNEVFGFIEKARHRNYYYKNRCKRLEELFTEAGEDVKFSDPKCITDERITNEMSISFLRQKIKKLEGVER